MPLASSRSVSRASAAQRQVPELLGVHAGLGPLVLPSQKKAPPAATPWFRLKYGYSWPERPRSGTVKVNQQVSVHSGSSLVGGVELVVGMHLGGHGRAQARPLKSA